MKFDNTTTFEQYFENCTIDYTITIEDIYKNYLIELDAANEEAKEETEMPKSSTYYEVFAKLFENTPNSFYLKPMEFINDKVSHYKDSRTRNEYLRRVIFEIQNRNEIFEINDDPRDLNTKDILLVMIISDYQNGFCPPLNNYKHFIRKFLKEEFDCGLSSSNPRPKKSQLSNFPQTNLKVQCKGVCDELIGSIGERILNFEIIKHCKSLMTEQTEQNITPTKKLKWKGKPAQLAYVISLLKEKGYIDFLPDDTTAKILLGAFDFDNYSPSKESLGNSLRKKTGVIKTDAYILRMEKLIPKLNDLV